MYQDQSKFYDWFSWHFFHQMTQRGCSHMMPFLGDRKCWQLVTMWGPGVGGVDLWNTPSLVIPMVWKLLTKREMRKRVSSKCWKFPNKLAAKMLIPTQIFTGLLVAPVRANTKDWMKRWEKGERWRPLVAILVALYSHSFVKLETDFPSGSNHGSYPRSNVIKLKTLSNNALQTLPPPILNC